ncbi:cyclic lactone autoinducer peptide [Paenibacillus flagellatus]|uniref:Cyclic lactone autoinducer peptide n=1 Tax=Paenibacillus flagellatus TaxID=2211139 RepID=A0A2V5KCI6_9BACL|nr:cyclic lactone autoinducer peptide [Paenibacillus flagellatus]PYI57329.1 cyclic lactone autoinducer peptide [Paenibacillus flagellatus]
MKRTIASMLSNTLQGIARYFVQTASPFGLHRPEVPEELRK